MGAAFTFVDLNNLTLSKLLLVTGEFFLTPSSPRSTFTKKDENGETSLKGHYGRWYRSVLNQFAMYTKDSERD